MCSWMNAMTCHLSEFKTFMDANEGNLVRITRAKWTKLEEQGLHIRASIHQAELTASNSSASAGASSSSSASKTDDCADK